MIALWVLLWILAGIFGLLVLTLILALAVPVTLSAHFQKEKGFTYEVSIRFLGIKLRLPISKWVNQKGEPRDADNQKTAKEESKSFIQKMKDLIVLYKQYKEVLIKIKAYIKPRLHIDEIEVKVDYGVGDAAVTGILYSMISGPLGILHSILDAHTTIHNRSFIITPHFNETLFEVSGDTKLRLRLWTVLTAWMKVRKEIRKIKIKQQQESEEEQWQIRWKKS